MSRPVHQIVVFRIAFVGDSREDSSKFDATYSRCSSVSSGYIGSDRIRLAAASVAGNSP